MNTSSGDPGFRRGRPVGPAAEGLVLGLVFFAIYLLTRSRDLGGDDTVFALAVDRALRGDCDWALLAHPHHPIFNLLVLAVARVAGVLGFHPLSADVGAGVAAFFAALTAGGLVVVLRRAGRGEGIALLAACAAGFSAGLWTFGTRFEVYTLEAAAVLLWLGVTGRPKPSGRSAGVALGGAVLSHLAAGVLALPTAWRRRRDRRQVATALLVGLGGAGAVWIGLRVVLDGIVSPSGWVHRLLGPAMAGYVHPGTPGDVAKALRNLVAWGFFHSVPVLKGGAAAGFAVAETVLVLLSAVLLALGIFRAARRRDPLSWTALLGVLAFLPLWLVWDVGNVEHAVGALPLLAVLLAEGVEALPRWIGGTFLGALALGLALVNGLGSAIPQSLAENGPVTVRAEFTASTVPRQALVLTLGMNPRLRLGLPYLSGRRFDDMALLLAGARRRGLPPSAALEAWLRRTREAQQLWALEDLFDPGAASWLAERGISPERWEAIRREFHVLDARTLPPDGIAVRQPFTLYRISASRGAHPPRPAPAPRPE